MNVAPFCPMGKTYLLIANSTAPTGILPVVNNALGSIQVHVMNAGDQIAYLACGNTAAIATAAAVIPTLGSPQSIIPILPKVAAVYSFPAGSYFSAITPATAATNIFLTLGDGA